MSSKSPIKLVLDTNVVLDWLVFDDPNLNALRDRLMADQAVVLTHRGAQEELRRVLGYAVLELNEKQQADMLSQYEFQTRLARLPTEFALNNLLLPNGFPCCKDPDDQQFIALAYHTAADALVSRDKAVLALRKSARKFGLKIINVSQMQQLLGAV